MLLFFYDLTMLIKRLSCQKSINFSEPDERLLGILKSEITEFDENLQNSSWFTQFYYGCLLFSMMNGNFLPEACSKFFAPNMDFSHEVANRRSREKLIKGVSHEYKAILLWNILTGNDVVSETRQKISQKIKEMLSADSLAEMYNIAQELESMYINEEQRFGIMEIDGKEKDFAFAEWSLRGYTADVLGDTNSHKFLTRKLSFLERCPRGTLFCDKFNHWMTFLGCNAENMYFYDSKLHGRLRKIEKNYVASIVISVLMNK